MNDLAELRDYARTGAEEAFTGIVRRHVDLVYSATLRLVRSPDLAGEVTQATFLDLAAQAGKLRENTQLAAWLHTVAHRRSVDVIRRETTRQRLEQAAAEEAALNRTDASWADLRPLIDEALEHLKAPDRTALLLRFFENRSLSEVAAALGCSTDAAQKRITRALEHLRRQFARRGVITASAALAADLSAHGITPAPAQLTLTITHAAASPATVAAALASVQTSGLSPLLFTVVKTAAVVALLGGAGFLTFQRWELHRNAAELDRLTHLANTWRHELQRLHAAHATAAAATATTGDEFASTDPAFDARLRTVFARLAQVRRRFAAEPSQAIPELALLSDADWFSVVAEQPRWDTADDWRTILANVRTRAINCSGSILSQALGTFIQKSGGQLPAKIDDLQPYCRPALAPALLARYELRAHGNVASVSDNDDVIAQKQATAIDPERDNLAVVGLHFVGVTGAQPPSALQVALRDATREPLQAYRAAHGGAGPKSPEELAPYFADQEKGQAYVAVTQTIKEQLPHFSTTNAVGYAHNLYRFAHHGAGPRTAADLVPYFQNPEDAAEYLRAFGSQAAP